MKTIKIMMGLTLGLASGLGMTWTQAAAKDAKLGTQEKPTALEILKKVETRRHPTSIKSKVTLTIDRGGSKVAKVFNLSTFKASDDETYTLVEFEKPGTTKILAHIRRKGADDRWVKTSSGQPKKIASSGDDQSFAQSHFTYEDLQFAKSSEFDPELLCDPQGSCTVDVLGGPAFKIKLKPKSQDKNFSYLIAYIRTSDYLPLKTEYFGSDQKMIKELTVDQVKDLPEGEKDQAKTYPIPLSITLKMADGSGLSRLDFSGQVVNDPSIKKQNFDKNLL